jgi:hypothetical protein
MTFGSVLHEVLTKLEDSQKLTPCNIYYLNVPIAFQENWILLPVCNWFTRKAHIIEKKQNLCEPGVWCGRNQPQDQQGK